MSQSAQASPCIVSKLELFICDHNTKGGNNNITVCMNDNAYLYANTSDKSIMYDLAVRRALGEVLAVLGGHRKGKINPLSPPKDSDFPSQFIP